MNDRVVEEADQNDGRTENHARKQTDGGVLDIAGRDARMGCDGIVDDLDRAVGDDVRDLLGQDGRDGVGQGTGLLGIVRGNRHRKEAGGVLGLGVDHLAQLFIGVVHPAAGDDQLHIRPGLEDGHIGLDQVRGGGELAGRNGDGAGEREGGVVDIEQGVGLVLRCDEEAGVAKGQSTEDDACQENADHMLPEDRDDLEKVDLILFFYIIRLLFCHGF